MVTAKKIDTVKIDYIEIDRSVIYGEDDFQGESPETIDTTRDMLIDEIEAKLEEDYAFIKICGPSNDIFYYNRNTCGLFPDFSKEESVRHFGPVSRYNHLVRAQNNDPPNYSHDVSGLTGRFVRRGELHDAFVNDVDFSHLCERFGWVDFSNRYIITETCKIGEVFPRISGGSKLRAGDNYETALYIIPVFDCKEWGITKKMPFRETLYILMEKGYSPVLEKKQNELLQTVLGFANSHIRQSYIKSLEGWQRDKIMEHLEDISLRRTGSDIDFSYMETVSQPVKGDWNLWKYKRYNGMDIASLTASHGKVWVDVSGLMLYARNPVEDVDLQGIVAVDFGTKSTTVAYLDGNGNIGFELVGKRPLNSKMNEKSYENPTILKFTDTVKFKTAYEASEGRPSTSFNDIASSHSAEADFSVRSVDKKIWSYLYRLKQWAYRGVAKVVDDKDYDLLLPPYGELAEGEFDPIEIYAYYVGLNVNHMGKYNIRLKYLLSYPPSYSSGICEKIRSSFERGIRKSLPEEVLQNEKMSNFSVKLGKSEPEAYAVCALKKYNILPESGNDVFCGVFDFGGGTVDYSFGRCSFISDSSPYRYQSLKNGGNPDLGCENILQHLAFEIFNQNREYLIRNRIPCFLPEGYDIGGEINFIDDSNQAGINSLNLIDLLREIWLGKKNISDGNQDVALFSKDKDSKLVLKTVKIKETEKIKDADKENDDDVIYLEKGYISQYFKNSVSNAIKEFFQLLHGVAGSLRDSFPKDATIHIFLAGNASHAGIVPEIFDEYKNDEQNKCFNIELHRPLPIPEDLKKIEENKGQIPSAKTGVAYGLLLARESANFIEVEEAPTEFPFRYHIGIINPQDEFVLKAPAREMAKGAFVDTVRSGSFELWYTDDSRIATLNHMPKNELNLAFISIPIGGSMRNWQLYVRTQENSETSVTVAVKNGADAKIIGWCDLKKQYFYQV